MAIDRAEHTPALIARSSELLRAMYDPERALFAYSTSLRDGAYVNDFDHTAVHRYTINTLAGIQRALRYHDLDWDIDLEIGRFLKRQRAYVTNPADLGLLLYVLATAAHPATGELFEQVEKIVGDRERMAGLDIQEVTWMLIGLTRHAEIDRGERATAAAERCFKAINRGWLDRDTLLPCFAARGYRRRFVSFGGVAYFLKSMYDYAAMAGDRYAGTIFTEGARQVIGLQGEMGEWPWFIDAAAGKVLDWYQVYSVHQDAMAMLFLLPALDLGVEEARPAIVASYRWLFGNNELGARMIVPEPFLIHRSIRRKGKWERERRLARAAFLSAIGTAARPAGPAHVEVNPECRSYHIGWILYAWAGRRDFGEFLELGVGNRE